MACPRPLTSACYTEGDAFQAEKRTVFSHAWLPVCHTAQLATPGDFMSHSIGGWPVFAIRGGDGTVRAFRNVCRHQQMQVVEKPSGHCDHLRCRYHGWTYDLAGRFVTAPDTVAPVDPCAPGNSLEPLRTRDLHGFVLFSLEVARQASIDEIDLDLGASGAAHAGALTAEIACNWKTYVEQRLAAADANGEALAWQWPLLLARPRQGGAVAEQVVPRTFLRTRVIFHALGDVQATLQAEADAARAAAEALQAQRAAGMLPVAEGSVGRLHAALDAALAHDTTA